ncbi:MULTISPECIES: phosphoribosylamine--glycine ligase [unclassified Nocardioides]|uniref:phosphoribosylamine--glycine ligase n=1 Tax=unclassified Nocardioides TaxID=2615069 RepID=UPI001153B8CC|nr:MULTISPECIES: phosphoribosylamine--glycine ligase [unclassified Nocardioides]TQK69307.1 phosphoribosylamine--glycine ligase [Nocardioides sp. SLBN-35]WGY01391.1 phosphoribosylamine--glycine ligase [Nocardioides sp. QY071]
MKTLVIGTGGREHALALALSRDPGVGEVHAAPGNPGIGAFATLHDVDPMDGAAVAALARSLGADLVVVGPEAPLVAGVADAVREAGIAVFGPSRAAAQLEGSKAFSKEVMAAAGVPTAGSRTCTTPEEVAAALDEFGAPYVVKDDALAAGKGVVVTLDRAEALAHAAGCGRVVVEEFLDGPEVSLFAVCDGTTTRPLQPAQDFKRIFDGGRGPNTGGMGSYSPLPWAPADLAGTVVDTVVQPTLDEMARRGAPFVGCLYVGLALTAAGPRVIEFNCRFGDPDVQPVLALLESPLGSLLLAAAEGRLADVEAPRFRDGASVTVVLASAGYPESSSKGDVITGVGRANGVADVDVIHAGTALVDDGDGDRLVTAGGRVLAVRAVGYDVADARSRAYAAADLVSFPGMQRRTDIAAEPLGVVEGASLSRAEDS